MHFADFIRIASGEDFHSDYDCEIPISPLVFRAAGLMEPNGTWSLQGKIKDPIDALVVLMYLTIIELQYADKEIILEDGAVVRGCYIHVDVDKEPPTVSSIGSMKEIFMNNRIATAHRIFGKKEVNRYEFLTNNKKPKEQESVGTLLVSNLGMATEKEKSILFQYLFEFNPFPHMFVELANEAEIQNKWLRLLIRVYNQNFNTRLRTAFYQMKNVYNQVSEYVEETLPLRNYTTRPSWDYGKSNSNYASKEEYSNLLGLYWLLNRIYNFYSSRKEQFNPQENSNIKNKLLSFWKLRYHYNDRKEPEFYNFKPQDIVGYMIAGYKGQHEQYKKIFPQYNPEGFDPETLHGRVLDLEDEIIRKNVYTGDYQVFLMNQVRWFYDKYFRSFTSKGRQIEVREKIRISSSQFEATLELANEIPTRPMDCRAASSTFNNAEREGPVVEICNNPVNPENSFQPNAMLLVLVGLHKELNSGGYGYYGGYTQRDAVLIILKVMYLQYMIESDPVMHMKMYLYYLSGEFRDMLQKYKAAGRANRVAYELTSIVNEMYEFATNGQDIEKANQLMDARFFQKTEEKLIDILFYLITNADVQTPEDEYRVEKLLKELPKDHTMYQAFYMYHKVLYHYDNRWEWNYLTKLWEIRKVVDFLHLDEEPSSRKTVDEELSSQKKEYQYVNTLRFLRDRRQAKVEPTPGATATPEAKVEAEVEMEVEVEDEYQQEAVEARKMLTSPMPEYLLLYRLNKQLNLDASGAIYQYRELREKLEKLENNVSSKDREEFLKERYEEIRDNAKFLFDEYEKYSNGDDENEENEENEKNENEENEEKEKNEKKKLLGRRIANPLRSLGSYFLKNIVDEEITFYVRRDLFYRDLEETEEERKERILVEYKQWSLYLDLLKDRLANYWWVFNITEEDIDILKRAVRIRAKALKLMGMEVYEETPEIKLEGALKLFGLNKKNPEEITRRDIITAYRRLALKYHPDRTAMEYNEYIWNDVRRGYELLMEKFGTE